MTLLFIVFYVLFFDFFDIMAHLWQHVVVQCKKILGQKSRKKAKQLKLFDIFVERINEQPIALRSSPETRESRVQDYRSHALFVCQMNFESFVDRMFA